MFSNRKITTSIKSYSDKIERFAELLQDADTVIIGAGAGLSASAGFTYTGKRFEDYFYDFIRKYGFEDMYSGGFYPFESLCEHWAYWSRYIFINVCQILLSETDGQHLLSAQNNLCLSQAQIIFCMFRYRSPYSGWLFYTQGDYGLFQCSEPCHNATYDNEKIIRDMVTQQEYMKIPTELIPHCPVCGKPMTMNLRADNTFVQDEGWYRANDRYSDFLRRHKGLKILFLELGVGMNTPGIIKYPFWRMAYDNPDAYYVSINYGEAFAPAEISRKSTCIQGDIKDVLFSVSA